MPTQEEIRAEQQKLYESASLRDELFDEPAQVLLSWGEQQVERVAQEYPEKFEEQCRYLRQLIKNINRFAGQREFTDEQGEQEYLDKIMMWLPRLGWESVTEADLRAGLPEDKSDMTANLRAILNTLTPPEEPATTEEPPAPEEPSTEEPTAGEAPENNILTTLIKALPAPELENDEPYSINQADIDQTGEEDDQEEKGY